MALLNPKDENKLYDPIRKKWVAVTPEEIIRQKIIRQMVDELAYPVQLIAVEKELSQLPHLLLSTKQTIPKRRADIIVFTHANDLFVPLLMIECKAVALTVKFANQVIGYNSFVKAPFIALANEHSMLTGHFDRTSGLYRFEPGLPHYSRFS